MEETERFKITDLETANWAFKKIKENEEVIEQNEQFATNEKEKIDRWLESENATHKESINFFEGLLTEYYMELKQEDPKAKISTPYGKVTSRKRQPKYIFDDNKVLDYLEKENPDLITISKKYNKNEIKKILNLTDDYQPVDENGQLVDFVLVQPQDENIIIKTDQMKKES